MRRGGVGAPDAEYAAFLAELVVVEGMGGQHPAREACSRGQTGMPRRFLAAAPQLTST